METAKFQDDALLTTVSATGYYDYPRAYKRTSVMRNSANQI